MTKSNTPLEITNHIKDNAAALFEVRRISKALSDISKNEADDATLRTIIRSLSATLGELAWNVSDAYWDACLLIQKLEEAVLEDTADCDDVEEDLPFVTPDGGDAE
jgi:hypothetical protein